MSFDPFMHNVKKWLNSKTYFKNFAAWTLLGIVNILMKWLASLISYTKHATSRFYWSQNKSSETSLNSAGWFRGCVWKKAVNLSYYKLLGAEPQINFESFGLLKHAFWEQYFWITRTHLFHDLLERVTKEENKYSSRILNWWNLLVSKFALAAIPAQTGGMSVFIVINLAPS